MIVQATRSRRRVQDETIRVEVLGDHEIEEKLLMRPGNISMLLNETGGLRVQVTSPAPGSANVRIYGMRGRYTQLLADGLPLYGGQALDDVINLVSKAPGTDASGEIILNATTQHAQDFSTYGDGWIDMPDYERFSARPRLFYDGPDGTTDDGLTRRMTHPPAGR